MPTRFTSPSNNSVRSYREACPCTSFSIPSSVTPLYGSRPPPCSWLRWASRISSGESSWRPSPVGRALFHARGPCAAGRAARAHPYLELHSGAPLRHSILGAAAPFRGSRARGSASALHRLADYDVHACRGQPGAQLRRSDPWRHAGNHALAKPGATGGAHTWDSHRPAYHRHRGHAHPDRVGRGRPGGRVGLTGHALEPVRRFLYQRGAADPPRRLHQVEHR